MSLTLVLPQSAQLPQPLTTSREATNATSFLHSSINDPLHPSTYIIHPPSLLLASLASQHHLSAHSISKYGPHGCPSFYIPISMHLPDHVRQLEARQRLAAAAKLWWPCEMTETCAPVLLGPCGSISQMNSMSLRDQLEEALKERLMTNILPNSSVKTSSTHPINVSAVIPVEVVTLISSHLTLSSHGPTAFEIPPAIFLDRLLASSRPVHARNNSFAIAAGHSVASETAVIGLRNRSRVDEDLQAAIGSTVTPSLVSKPLSEMPCFAIDDVELDFLGAPWPEYEIAARSFGLSVLRIPIPEGLAPLSPADLDLHLTLLIQSYTLRGIPILVPFESFLENTPPIPTLQTGTNPLHTFLGFDPQQNILVLTLRDPNDSRELPPNGNDSVSIATGRGVRKVTPASWHSCVQACSPDLVVALPDIPWTPPPHSQKRVSKMLARSASWLADILRPSVRPQNILVHMAGGISSPARAEFSIRLLETIEDEAGVVASDRCLDDGVMGYTFDLLPLRLGLQISNEGSDNMIALLRQSLQPLPQTKIRVVNSVVSPHDLLRLVRDIGVDIFDSKWAQDAAHYGFALDFAFPIQSTGEMQSIGHNLYDHRYAHDFSCLASALPLCSCIACSPENPPAVILHSKLDTHDACGLRPESYSRAYIHHLLHTHEMSAHTYLTMHNIAVLEAFLAGIRDLIQSGQDFAAEVDRHVFLGLALLELGNYAMSEQAYQHAIDASPEQPLAWQGLLKFYERFEQWDRYAETARRLTDLFAQLGDALKCVEALGKLVDCRREKGTSRQLVEVLSLLLENSSLYPLLSTLPVPDHINPDMTPAYHIQSAIHNTLPTLEEILGIIEKEEDSIYLSEVAKRRTRLGASSPEQLRKEVGLEIWSSSQVCVLFQFLIRALMSRNLKLPHYYDAVLNHPNTSDDLRRKTDAKLLRYKHRYLCALPAHSSVKITVAREVDELAAGAITLGLPDALAWSIYLDGKDWIDPAHFEMRLLQQFMQLLPRSGLALFLKAFCQFSSIPLVDDENGGTLILVDGDPFDIMLVRSFVLPRSVNDSLSLQDSFASLSDSVLATQIMGSVYLTEADYQNSMVVAENGLSILSRAEADFGKQFPNTRLGFNVTLATSLVHLFPPKHHSRALSLLDQILRQAPTNTAGLMGRAFVLQQQQHWAEAAEVFAQAIASLAESSPMRIRAREEEAWCQTRAGNLDEGITVLKSVLTVLDTGDGAEADSARCLWRLGASYWDLGENHIEDAYRHFIQSLKRNSSYAPSYTSLGIYYAEFANPTDAARASKCFQKAFEIDAREAEAARRLAEGFADEREWDLVEVVARRTIEGEGGLTAGLTAESSARLLPTNAWAWKALGVVELAHANYPAAIRAFQITLRAEPDDQVCWLRLGEAYSRAGRHAAAIKALERAHELEPEDWICRFFLGDVQHQIGQHQEAIDVFENILIDRPLEIGVLIASAKAFLDLGCSELSNGFPTRAEGSLITCLRTAIKALEASPGFRSVAWKTAADAVFHLSARPAYVDEIGTTAVLEKLITLLPRDLSGRVASFLKPELKSPLTCAAVLHIAIAAYDCRVSLGSTDNTALGSAWYDLGMSLLCISRKLFTGDVQTRVQAQAQESLKHALREDPGNDLYWVGLGDANFLTHAKMAQHAYIKALEIDFQNARTWSNLGLLYLRQNDVDLANQAFLRAQTLDPEWTVAWVGQALVASANGHEVDSTALLEHALLRHHQPEADLEFASRTIKRLHANPIQIDGVLPTFSVLDRYQRIRHELMLRAITILEAEYEQSEHPDVERQFTIATLNLARIKLALQDYESSAESFENVLGLLGDCNDQATQTMVAHAHFGLGLANFKSGDSHAAITLLEGALESSASETVVRSHIAVLLAQTMWTIGSEDCKESAKAHLLDCTTTDPENLAAINTLAGMGILTEDDGLVDAALADLLALPPDRRFTLDPSRDVDDLLLQHRLGQGNLSLAMAIAQGSVMAEPSRAEARQQLALLNVQRGEPSAAVALLSTESSDTPAWKHLALQAMSLSLKGDCDNSAVSLAQKLVFLRPWDEDHWQALAHAS
ncbi:unnamed protein product [Mycena citricolor]|uniref:tRNA-guanine(15) transglycosylase-like domain-containing protein n=1 Tax=Mycena citricolor TaxID=2018698 RepID=A0AAD2Q1E2_9AGAR|nr:unnamed protein product [Mycena citricolor]